MSNGTQPEASSKRRGWLRAGLRAPGSIGLSLVLLLLTVWAAAAQQLDPRAYSNTPVGMNFLLTGYAYTEGDVATDPSLPLKDGQVDSHTTLLAYARSLSVWHRSAKFDVILGHAWLSGSATFMGTPVSRAVSGIIDPQFRFSMCFYGAPALTLAEFKDYRQDLVIGTSLAVTAPLGQYDSDKLLNVGNNRWSIKPGLGISKAFGPVTLELVPAVTIYTDNNDFLGHTREQDLIVSTEAHVIYSFSRGIWASVDGTYYTGGRTTLDGVEGDDLQENFRAGATLSIPLGRRQSIKFYGSTGVHARTGGNFWLVGLAFQYRWGGGL